MRSRNIQHVFILLTAFLAVIIGGGTVLGQGKGHGADNKGGGEKHGGQSAGPQRQNGPPPGQQQRQQQPRPQAQREQQPHQQQQRQQAQQQQRQQRRNEIPPVQQQPQQQRQQARRPDVVRTEQRRPDLRQLPDTRVFEQRQNRIEQRSQPNGEARQQQRGNGNSQAPGQQRQFPLNNAWPNNYGNQRSSEVHDRNAERKAWKNEEKSLRNDRRGIGSYAPMYQVYPYNGSYQSVYQYPEHRRISVLRTLIASVLGSNTGYNDNYYSQYQPAYYGDPYYPANYSGNYYNGYPQYQSFAAAPYYADYQPYGYGYDPQYAYDPYYADNYSYNQQPSYYTNSASGGGFLRRLFSRLLALGYDQGYNDGLSARRAGYGDRYYSDPYAYEDTNYVPYSNSLGENRRCLSDGYQLGYDDALYNQPGSDRYYQNGNVDLISILIGDGLQT